MAYSLKGCFLRISKAAKDKSLENPRKVRERVSGKSSRNYLENRLEKFFLHKNRVKNNMNHKTPEDNINALGFFILIIYTILCLPFFVIWHGLGYLAAFIQYLEKVMERICTIIVLPVRQRIVEPAVKRSKLANTSMDFDNDL